MNRRQVSVLLRHRDQGGELDWSLLKAANRDRQKKPDEEATDGFEKIRYVRRMQGWPEYLIEKQIRALRAASDGSKKRT